MSFFTLLDLVTFQVYKRSHHEKRTMKNRTQKCTLTFLGGAGTVTGSKTLLEVGNTKVMIDCGLFQGIKELRLKNRAPFPVDPTTIDAIILTHAHLDHCGYIPLLVKKGFKGVIHCTSPTKELTEIILKDSAKIQEEDAERAARHKYSKHEKPEPLYTVKDVMDSLSLFVEHELNEWVKIDEQIKFELLNSGHILGSAFVNLVADGKKIVFSGDIGRTKPLILYPPKPIKEADYIIMESTYGDREHAVENEKEELRAVIQETYENRGILMIPSFAVERTQEIIYILHQLREEGNLPALPIYLDSPMGINATNVYDRFHSWQNIPNSQINQRYDSIRFIEDVDHSKAIVADEAPKIVIAGSGMIEGGRILHYLNNHMDNRRNTLLFIGYQGIGTRGRAIMEGTKEIKFFGQYRKVNCQIRSIGSLSGHGDRNEMNAWLKHFDHAPKKIFLNHGEAHQSDAFRVKIQHELNWDVTIPQLGDCIELE